MTPPSRRRKLKYIEDSKRLELPIRNPYHSISLVTLLHTRLRDIVLIRVGYTHLGTCPSEAYTHHLTKLNQKEKRSKSCLILHNRWTASTRGPPPPSPLSLDNTYIYIYIQRVSSEAHVRPCRRKIVPCRRIDGSEMIAPRRARKEGDPGSVMRAAA